MRAAPGWLKEAEFGRKGRCLGVASFNRQRMLIEDPLHEARREDSEL